MKVSILISSAVVCAVGAQDLDPLCGDCFCIPDSDCPSSQEGITQSYQDAIPFLYATFLPTNTIPLQAEDGSSPCYPFVNALDLENSYPEALAPECEKPETQDGFCAFVFKDGNTDLVDVLQCGARRYEMETFENEEDVPPEASITHAGPCGVCSSAQDLAAHMMSQDSFEELLALCEARYLLAATDDPFEDLVECFEAEGFTRDCATLYGHFAATNAALCASVCPVNASPFNGDPPECELSECLACSESFRSTMNEIAGRTMANSGMTENIARPCSDFYPVEQDPCPGLTVPPLPFSPTSTPTKQTATPTSATSTPTTTTATPTSATATPTAATATPTSATATPTTATATPSIDSDTDTATPTTATATTMPTTTATATPTTSDASPPTLGPSASLLPTPAGETPAPQQTLTPTFEPSVSSMLPSVSSMVPSVPVLPTSQAPVSGTVICPDGHRCENGAQCVEAEQGVFLCNCTTAVPAEDDFAGLFCEHEVTSYCDACNETFCVNGGLCVEQSKECFEEDHPGCDCPEGFEGQLCEIVSGTTPAPQDTTPSTVGPSISVPPTVTLPATGQDTTSPTSGPSSSGPPSFLPTSQGSDNCSDDNPCENGADCVQDSSDDSIFRCDCTTAMPAEEDFAGPFCEYTGVSYCDSCRESFCVNNGDCLNKSRQCFTIHPGCTCAVGFEGQSCELVSGTTPAPQDTITPAPQDTTTAAPQDATPTAVGPTAVSPSLSMPPPTPESSSFPPSQMPATGPTNCRPCQNGAECVEDSFNAGFYFCDCNTTVPSDEDFDGLSCEFKATSYCDDCNSTFCVNDGTCLATVQGCATVHPGCKCPQGFLGPSCEFSFETIVPMPPPTPPPSEVLSMPPTPPEIMQPTFENATCDLNCTNGGVCAFVDLPPGNGSDPNSTIDGMYYCECAAGFTGVTCEKNATCGLNCTNGGVCAFVEDGLPPVNGSDPTIDDMYYCECAAGFTGVTCDINVVECGDTMCFNGGACTEIMSSINAANSTTNSTTNYYCDCNAPPHLEMFSAAGNSCEAVATSYCTKYPDTNGHSFCANDGACGEDFPYDCTCPNDSYGPRCEFSSPPAECTTKCLNGGQCGLGSKEHGILNSISGLERYTEDFEHCVCPTGFGGVLCEFPVLGCFNTSCFDESTCDEIPWAGGNTCKCTSDVIQFPYGSCQEDPNNATVYCLDDGLCTKECKKGFVGEYCEIQLSTLAPSSAPSLAPSLAPVVFIPNATEPPTNSTNSTAPSPAPSSAPSMSASAVCVAVGIITCFLAFH